jgi:hypothetical protein
MAAGEKRCRMALPVNMKELRWMGWLMSPMQTMRPRASSTTLEQSWRSLILVE